MDGKLPAVSLALQKRGFRTSLFETTEEAVSYVKEIARGLGTVASGGSMTIAKNGFLEALEAPGREVLYHGREGLSHGERMEIMHKALAADLYLLGANAITLDGRIVNIDGNGNRVAASIFGPGRIVFVAGKNKIVDGGIDEAIMRIKREACPQNCRRLGRKTPCAATGTCHDCNSPDRICNVTVIFDRAPPISRAEVVLVDRNLGF